MAVIYEHDENTPVPEGAVDGMAAFLDPEEDVSSTDWDPTVDDFPSYLNLDAPSQTGRAVVLHNLIDSHGGPEGLAQELAAMEPAQRQTLIATLARVGGLSEEHVEHHVIGDPEGAAAYLAQLDGHHSAQAPAVDQALPGSDVHADALEAELKADLMEAILDDPASPEVDKLIRRLASLLAER